MGAAAPRQFRSHSVFGRQISVRRLGRWRWWILVYVEILGTPEIVAAARSCQPLSTIFERGVTRSRGQTRRVLDSVLQGILTLLLIDRATRRRWTVVVAVVGNARLSWTIAAAVQCRLAPALVQESETHGQTQGGGDDERSVFIRKLHFF